MKNVIRRYDTITIPSHSKKNPVIETAEDTSTTRQLLLADPVPTKKARRQDDTPPLGSLGGWKPRALAKVKVKPPKVKKKRTPPGLMKIYDSEGREWGRPLWREEQRLKIDN